MRSATTRIPSAPPTSRDWPRAFRGLSRDPDLWWRLYAEYLNSTEWKLKRADVLGRCMGICESCGRGRATQVHHRTYRYVGREPLWDLGGVCEDCHEWLTEADREGRMRKEGRG